MLFLKMATQSCLLWQPKEEKLRKICYLLEQQTSPTSDKPRIYQKLRHYTQFHDFNNYLAFIFARAQDKSVEIRQAAGLLLKNNLRSSFKCMDLAACQQYIKSEMLHCLGAVDKRIRATAGTIISVIIQQIRFDGWPELLQALIQRLDSNDLDHMEGAMDTLSKICEDIPKELDSNVLGLADRPLDLVLPRLLQLLQSPEASLRKLSLQSINQFIMLMPTALYQSMDKYLRGLFYLAHDPVAEVRKLVCLAFVLLIDVNPSLVEPHMRNIVEFMLQASQDKDKDVALEACGFWLAYGEVQLNPELLREFLCLLIPVLLSNMIYADDDESLIDAEEDDTLPDRDQNIRLHFQSSRFHRSDDMKDDDNDDFNIWNLRKCSADGLNIISNIYGGDILPILIPIVEAKLSSSDDETWKEREAAVLALGAIAEGCIGGLYHHLPEIVACLISMLDDKFPLVRSMACWTLSRFNKFIIQGEEQFNNVLMGLLWRMLDGNKRVQEAACFAFATLGEEAAKELDLAPYSEVIIQHLMYAVGAYQGRNLQIAYGAISTLAGAVGVKLNQPKNLDILMHPLFAKWLDLSDSDKELVPMFDCLTSIVKAVGIGFSHFAEPVFERCMNTIHFQRFAKAYPSSTRAQYDKEFIVCSLNLLSGLVEGLGNGIKKMVSQSNLKDVLPEFCGDDAPDVRQRALALLGNLAKNLYFLDQFCPFCLWPSTSNLLNVASKQLIKSITELKKSILVANNACWVPRDTTELKESMWVANNACWAIGEIAPKMIEEMPPVLITVISCLSLILCHPKSLNSSLVLNSTITLGKLALVCPEIVSPHMEQFMLPWCTSLSMTRDGVQKEEAFRGLCAIVSLNPTEALNSIVYICRAIASWDYEVMSSSLRREVSRMLHASKQMPNDGSWEQCMSALEPLVKEKLSKYQV